MPDTCLISNIWPFQERINHDQLLAILERTGKINVNALAWVIWNGPCRQIFMMIWAGLATSRTVIAMGSNVDLDVRPPHMHAFDFKRVIQTYVKCRMLRL